MPHQLQMAAEAARGPGWFKGGRTPPLPPPAPSNSVSAICKKLCTLHCQDRSELLKLSTSIEDISNGVRFFVVLCGLGKYLVCSGKTSSSTVLTGLWTRSLGLPALMKSILSGFSRGNAHMHIQLFCLNMLGHSPT